MNEQKVISEIRTSFTFLMLSLGLNFLIYWMGACALQYGIIKKIDALSGQVQSISREATP